MKLHNYNYFILISGLSNLFQDAYPKPVPKEVPPCTDAYGMTTYLNRSDVRKALHIPDSAPEWSACSDLQYSRQYLNMSQQYKALVAKNVRCAYQMFF